VPNSISSYINARVAAIAFARRVQVWPRTIARLKTQRAFAGVGFVLHRPFHRVE